MPPSPIIWSAQSCPFHGAGAYVGLASCQQHYTVARWLLPKRAMPYAGASVRLRPEDHWPLSYFAVRDPSAVAVLPARQSEIARKHVLLRFEFNHRTPGPPKLSPEFAEAEAVKRLCHDADEHKHGAFLVTIGLPVRLERELYGLVALSYPGQPWADLCRRVAEFGGRSGAGG